MGPETRDATSGPAEALASTPLFAGLSPVDLARLVPELEELTFEPGQIVFSEGAEPDGFYLIRQGVARVLGSAGRPEHDTLAILGPPDYFGEMALLSNEPRSATVSAVTPLSVWRLSTQRFHELIAEQPSLPLEIAAALSRRLAATDRQLSHARRDLHELAMEALTVLPPPAREALLRASPLREIDPLVLERALDRSGLAELLAAIERRTAFVQPAGLGRYRFAEEWVRVTLCEALRAELGGAGFREWQMQLASALEAGRDWRAAAEQALAAENWPAARRLLARACSELLATEPAEAERLLRQLPPDELAADHVLLRALAEACVAQDKPGQAIAVYEQAIEAATRRGDSPPIELQQALARLMAEGGQTDRALGSLRMALVSTGALRSDDRGLEGNGGGFGVLPQGDTGAERLRRGNLALAGARGLARASAAAGLLRRLPLARGIITALIGVLLLGIWRAPPPPGLSQPAEHAILLLIASLAVSMLGWLPEYVAALLMLALWVSTGLVPLRVAASGFSSPTWFLLFSTMAVGAALARSGLLYRAALEMLQRLPPRYPVLAVALATFGALISPGMPNVSGRISLAGPVAQDIADSLRYPPRSGGTAGLALATYLGFGQMSALFLTASPSALILYGLLPPDVRAQVSFGSWFLVALPLHLAIFVGMLTFILTRFRPPPAGLSEQTLQLQRAVLGKVGRGEWIALAVLLCLLIGFSTQSLHGLEPAWLGLFAVAALIATRLLDGDALRRGVNWTFLLYLGVTLSLNEVFSSLQIDRWLGESLRPVIDLLARRPEAFILGIALLAFLLALLLRMGTTVLLLALALFPVAAQAGPSPWIVALTLLVSANQWLYPQQSVVYLTLYYGSEERAFSHAQVRPAAFVFAALVFLGLALSLPYWRWLGLIR